MLEGVTLYVLLAVVAGRPVALDYFPNLYTCQDALKAAQEAPAALPQAERLDCEQYILAKPVDVGM